MQSMFPKKLRKFFSDIWQVSEKRKYVQASFELLLIGMWAVWVGRAYLDMNPNIVPTGREFSSSVQAHHMWTRFQECGWCAVWDGSERGGFPAFVDPLASSLYPPVILTTLIFGVINGSKVMIIFTLWMAGIAQWWLGKVLKFSWLPRMWAAALVVVGGHLSGRLELGTICSIISTAAVSMTFAPAIRLSQTGKKRDAVIFAIVLALMAVSGQGYMQAGFIFMGPAYLILILKSEVGEKLLWRRYLLAAGLGLLLAAPFLVPYMHFWPNFLKDSDPNFGAGQPLQYYLINLLIDSPDYFFDTALEHLPFPNLYTMFIGWVPVVFAALGLGMMQKKDRRPLLFLAVSAAIILWVGTAQPLQLIQEFFPWVTSLRFITITGGLAVPGIIALASYAVDRLMKFDWPRLALIFSNKNESNLRGVNLGLLLIIPLLINVHKGFQFSQAWYFMERVDENVYKVIDALETDDLQWVQPPFGEHFFIEDAVHRQMKLSPGIMTWRWREREFPSPILMASHSSAPEPYEKIDEINGTKIFERDDVAYATIVNDDQVATCNASGWGGELTVKCDTSISGTLVVQENTWSGWKAWMDGEKVSLVGDRWLEVDAPAGKHTYHFRYLPWDVPMGLVLSGIGIILCVWLWFFSPKEVQKVEHFVNSEKLDEKLEVEV